MTNRDLIKIEIDALPDDMVNFVWEFVHVLKNYKIDSIISDSDEDEMDEAQQGYQEISKFRGTLKREIDIKKERLEALDEKYNNLS